MNRNFMFCKPHKFLFIMQNDSLNIRTYISILFFPKIFSMRRKFTLCIFKMHVNYFIVSNSYMHMLIIIYHNTMT